MQSLERYKRNISLEKISTQGQEKLLSSKVLIAGAGGLGSSVISNLACIGIGTLGVIDYDNIEITNLNRQFIHSPHKIGVEKVVSAKEWLKNFNPEIKVNDYNLKLNENNCSQMLKDYDIIIDCFDSYESKFMLNKACVQTNKTLIHGGAQEFMGQVITIIPNQSACLACIFDDYTKNLPPKGILSPIVSIIGSIQATEVVKVLIGEEKLLTNTILSYDCFEQNFKKLSIARNNNCSICKNQCRG